MTDHRGLRRQFSTRTKDRGTALAVAHKIERIKDIRIRGDQLPQDLVVWVANRHKDLRQCLVDWQMIEASAVGAGELLCNPPAPDPLPPDWKIPEPALIEQWEQILLAAEVTPDHARQSATRVRKLFELPVKDLLPLRYPGDISSESVMPRIRELRRIGAKHGHAKRKRKAFGPKTCQYYLDRAREFCGWLITRGILTTNPLAQAIAYTAPVMREHAERVRRALPLNEQILLITKTPELPDRNGITGIERSRIYHTALRAGLRAKEIHALRARHVNLFTKEITVAVGSDKARHEEILPIVEDLIEPLREQLKGKLPEAPLFTPIGHKKYCGMLHEDEEVLGIPFKDEMERYADFHALRHTYGTELAKAVMPAEHMKLMRHKDIRTTIAFYVHLEQQAKAAAIAKLPRLELPEARNNTKVG